MTSKQAIITHQICQLHDMGEGHSESPQRLKVLEPVFDQYEVFEAQKADDSQIMFAHRYDYIEYLRQNVPTDGLRHIDSDTAIGAHSIDAAEYGVGAACQAVDMVLSDKFKHIFCGVRPPGHHAEPNRACGFCFFCNPYIAVRYAQEKYGIGKVVIIDFDVHHGNGTAACVRDQARDDIMYVSTHQWPLFPGTGNPEMEDDFDGMILDVPLPAGAGSELFRSAYEDHIFPKIREFNPALLIISAGFDAHKDDPLAGFNLTDEDYFWIAGQIADFKLPVVSILEGGYNLEALKSSVENYLNAFND